MVSDARCPPYVFNKEQKRAWEALECQLNSSVIRQGTQEQDIDHDKASTPILSLLEAACLRVCIALLQQKVKVYKYESPLVCASALLRLTANGWKEVG